jgi:hypothetical protein
MLQSHVIYCAHAPHLHQPSVICVPKFSRHYQKYLAGLTSPLSLLCVVSGILQCSAGSLFDWRNTAKSLCIRVKTNVLSDTCGHTTFELPMILPAAVNVWKIYNRILCGVTSNIHAILIGWKVKRGCLALFCIQSHQMTLSRITNSCRIRHRPGRSQLMWDMCNIMLIRW